MKAKLIFYSTMFAIYIRIVIINIAIAIFPKEVPFEQLEWRFNIILAWLFASLISCFFARHYIGSAWHGILSLLLFIMILGSIFQL